MDARTTDPFPFYDAEIRRLRRYLRRLPPAGWRRPSHCRGWNVKDIVSHLCTDELYNQACLDGTLRELDFAGGLHAWNERGVRARRHLAPGKVLAEWIRRQGDVRRRWGQLGLRARIATSVGPYPLRLQVWHLAREYAIHADDIRIPTPARGQKARLRWRAAFGLFAAHEEGEPVLARLREDRVDLRLDGRQEKLDLETFVAYLGDRPQHLADPAKRKLVRRLLA
jgi:uncharacterized protein (TIGR03083 family)